MVQGIDSSRDRRDNRGITEWATVVTEYRPTKDRGNRRNHVFFLNCSTSPDDTEKTTGIAKGISTAMVPQEVPVEKEISAPVRNTAAGSSSSGNRPSRTDDKKSAAPSWRDDCPKHPSGNEN